MLLKIHHGMIILRWSLALSCDEILLRNKLLISWSTATNRGEIKILLFQVILREKWILNGQTLRD